MLPPHDTSLFLVGPTCFHNDSTSEYLSSKGIILGSNLNSLSATVPLIWVLPSMVFGDAYSSPPSTGSYTYTGTQTIHASTNAAPGSIGTFSMTIDFGEDTFSYTGSSGLFTVSGFGTVDDTNGRFSTEALSVRHARRST